MLHLITMDELILRVASQKRKNNFFEVSFESQFRVTYNILKGIVEKFSYGDRCIVVHSKYINNFNNSLKKNLINTNIESKEKDFERRYGFEFNELKYKIFIELKNNFENLNNFVFLDSSYDLTELELCYGYSKINTSEEITIYSNDELTYQIPQNINVETHFHKYQTKQIRLETKIRLVLFGSFYLGISNCLPEFVFDEKKYSVQFGDKTISKIYNDINFELFDENNFIEELFPILFKYTIKKYDIKLNEDKIEDTIKNEQLDILEMILKHNINQNLRLISFEQKVQTYSFEIKDLFNKIPNTFKSNIRVTPKLKCF